MSRQNTEHTPNSIRDLAQQLAKRAVALEIVADRWNREHPQLVLTLAHQVAIENGIAGAKKLARETEMKLALSGDLQLC